MPVDRRFLRLTLADRDGNTSEMTVRPSLIVNLQDTVDAAIDVLVPAVHGVSDGIVQRVEAIVRVNDSSPAVNPDTPFSRRVIILINNGTPELASIIIPAFSASIDSVDGYDNARIPDLTVFNDLIAALGDNGAMDVTGILIAGDVVAAALIV